MDPLVLDDIAEIRKIDKNNMLSYIENIAEHYKMARKNSDAISVNYPYPSNIIIAGMGGSAIGGEILQNWVKDKINVPLEVIRAYSLPAYANFQSLVLVLSYSGETEESLSVFLDALKKGCMIYCISSGGNLIKHAKRLGVPHLMVPSGMPPRAALPYMLTPLLLLIEKIGLVTTLSDELVEAIEILKQISKDNLPKIPTNKNQSKQIAMGIGNTVPVIYAFGIYSSIAHRFKQQFNENSKIPSAWDIFSELNHNEIVGWEQSGKFSKKYSLIFLRDKIEPIQMKSRIEITKSISSLPLKTFDVWSKGNCDLAKMLSILCIGDFASVYHAILNNIDPTPVNTINLLKKKIIAFGTKEKILIDLNKFQI